MQIRTEAFECGLRNDCAWRRGHGAERDENGILSLNVAKIKNSLDLIP